MNQTHHDLGAVPMFFCKNFMSKLVPETSSLKNIALKLPQEFVDNLTHRKAAAEAYLNTLVSDEFEKYEKGEWVALVRAQARKEEGPQMAD